MDEKQLAALADEIKKPVYAGMTEQQIVDSLNAVDKVVDKPFVQGVQAGNQIDIADFNKLTDTQQNLLASIWVMANVPGVGFYRDLLFSFFPEESQTHQNLVSIFTFLTSTAEVLGLGAVKVNHVKRAKSINENLPEPEERNTGDLKVALPPAMASRLLEGSEIEFETRGDKTRLLLSDILDLIEKFSEPEKQEVYDYLTKEAGLDRKDVGLSEEATLNAGDVTDAE